VIFTLLFMAAAAAVVAWWLARNGWLAAKPWLETGAPGEVLDTGASPLPAAKIGLGVFLAVAGSLLVLLVSAYVMRMEMEDWRPLPRPGLLWVNTGVLVLGSVALHRARAAAWRGEREALGSWLLAGGLAGVAFVLGQAVAWRQLAAAGYRPSTGPADSFFYLITAVHGLHVLGGLAALARTGARLRQGGGAVTERLRLGVELCATYWHFLLVAWIALFALIAYSPSFAWLYAVCRAPFG
jgi:cytochrome c oxidase subunit 3